MPEAASQLAGARIRGAFPPGRLAETVTALYGDIGASWLERLPATIALCEERWSFSALPPLDDLSYNYIAPAVLRDGAPVILKLGVPGSDLNPELECEIEALRRFDGRGSVRLIDVDRRIGALLLERVVPGYTLATVADDEEATRIAAHVMRQLWRPVEVDHPFPTVELWGQGFARMRERFDGGTGPLPEKLTREAEHLFGELVASASAPVLLHGDLHHWNILRATRELWLAIDPKGVVGEPAYEVGALMRNRLGRVLQGGNPVAVVRRRLDILAEALIIDRDRIQGWALAQAVLSAWWDIEDGTGQGADAIRFARLVERADP